MLGTELVGFTRIKLIAIKDDKRSKGRSALNRYISRDGHSRQLRVQLFAYAVFSSQT
jgi:hypothetical protein